MLICPFDTLPLTETDKTAFCSNGHSFDRAREGYLNLLPVQAKQAKDPGDSPEMVRARRDFLATEAYRPIMTAIAEACVPAGNILLDAGCGEGAYLRFLKDALPATMCYGLDISKHAIRAAARTRRDIHWLVASNKALPFPDKSLGVILCAFGFPVWPEFRRALQPDGIVILADPGPDHLLELRRRLYSEIKIKPDSFTVPDGFTLRETRIVRDIFHPDSTALRDLIAMTPHQHRASSDAIAAVLQEGCADITLDVTLRVLQPA